MEALPDEERAIDRADIHHYESSRDPLPDPDRGRHQRLLQDALNQAVATLNPKDRLRLGCYYGQGLTLAETGRVLREQEATVSRHLARTRQAIRGEVERHLRDEAGLSDAQISECFAAVSADAGPIDLNRMLTMSAERKETAPDRSR